MRGVKTVSALLLALSVLATASVVLAGGRDEVVQAPRAQDIQAPRSHGSQDIQAPRGPEAR